MTAPTGLSGRWGVKRLRAGLLMVLLLLCCTQVRAEWFSETRAIMGTDVRVTLWHDRPEQAQQAIRAVMAEMQRIDDTYSPYREHSDLARINAQAAHQSMPLSPEFVHLVKRSLHFSALSGGAFDITFASLGWHYDYRAGQQPDTDRQQALLPAINYRLLNLDEAQGQLRFGHPDMRIDLGAIAKGYAVDRSIDILQRLGIRHASVSAGGDSRLLGDRMGRPWLIGIKNPRQSSADARDVVLTMPLSDLAISTSGDYERYFMDDQGQRVHHILNPRTGRPAEELISVTVLGPVATDTDAVSTAVFVLGVARGLALLNSLPDFDGVLIDKQGVVHYSAGLQTPD